VEERELLGYGARHMPTFSREAVRALYDQPLLPLLDEARRTHRSHHPDSDVELCTRRRARGGSALRMGESAVERCEMLHALANRVPQPESVSIDALGNIGTSLASGPAVDALDLVRLIAVARILMPRAAIRLSAARASLRREAQMLCILAGVSSILFGEDPMTAMEDRSPGEVTLIRDSHPVSASRRSAEAG
jgi:biotin synthase-like enzyme